MSRTVTYCPSRTWEGVGEYVECGNGMKRKLADHAEDECD